MKKVRTLQQNMLYNTIGSLVYYCSQWLMTIVIVRLSGFTDAGRLSVAISVTAVASIIGLFNIRSFQVSDLENKYTDYEYLRARWYTNIMSIFVCVVIILYFGYSFEQVIIILAFMGFKVVEQTADVYYGVDQKKERMDFVGISMMIRGIGSLVLFCVGFQVTGSLFASIIGMSIFSLLVVLCYDKRVTGICVEKEKRNGKELRKQVKSMLITCFPLAVVAFLNNFSVTVPRLYLEQYFGDEILGFYSSVASPTVIIQLAATTLFAPMIPPLALEFKTGNKKKFLDGLKKFLLLLAVITVVALIGSKLFARWGLVLLFGEKIEPYVYLFIPIIVISILIALNASMFSVCTLMREIKSQYLIGIFGILSSLVFSITLVKKYEMEGVVAALLGTLLIQILIQVIIIYRKIKRMEK